MRKLFALLLSCVISASLIAPSQASTFATQGGRQGYSATNPPVAPQNMKKYRGYNGNMNIFRVRGTKAGRIWGGHDYYYTDDSDVATAATHAGVVQLGEWAVVRVVVRPGRSSYPGICRRNICSQSYGSYAGSFQIITGEAGKVPGVDPVPPEERARSSSGKVSGKDSSNVSGNVSSNVATYRGQNGIIIMPTVTGSTSGRIWGGSGNVYTDDSNLGTAAVHAGVLAPGQTGKVRVSILPGRDSYPSITRNGVSSIKYGKWHGSYQILGAASQGAAPPPAPRPGAPAQPAKPAATAPAAIPAPSTMAAYRGKNGQTFSMRVTGAASGRIWGGSGNVYTDDSNLAAAAVHAGLVAPGQTAVIRVTVLPGRDSYPSISRNGISSIKYGKWHGSYSLSR